MNWNRLHAKSELDSIAAASFKTPQILFKHSTTCIISAAALERMNAELTRFAGKAELHLLDLLAYRDVSNAIAERFHVHHESPQLLLIRNGECTVELSHREIAPNTVLAELAA